MYLLDYKIPKALHPLRGKILDLFISWLEGKGHSLTKHKTSLAENVVGCFVRNTLYRLSYGKDVIRIPRQKFIYSQPLIYNANKVNRKISFTYQMLFCDFLVEYFCCYECKGSLHYEVDKLETVKTGETVFVLVDKYVTGYKLSEDLVSFFHGYQLKPNEVDYSVIEVRDKDGKPISKRLTETQKEMMKILLDLNIKYQSKTVMLDEEYLDLQIKKIYNNSSFECGGRMYITGKDSTKAVSKEKRLKLRINGEPCVELDYKHLHPSIMADFSGDKFPEYFDPYGITIDGCCPNTVREIAKKGLLILINTDNVKAAHYALSSALSDKYYQDLIATARSKGMWYDGTIVLHVIEKLVERNGYVMNRTSIDNGLKLMNTESAITDLVIEKVLMDGYVLIPIHDGFIVPESAKDSTYNHMQKAYEIVVGGDNCRISCKVAEV